MDIPYLNERPQEFQLFSLELSSFKPTYTCPPTAWSLLKHLGHFLDWINQVNGRWILKAILLPRLPTTEIFATNLLPSVVRANDLEAVCFLLSVGASPNTTTTIPLFGFDEPRPRTEPYRSALCEAIRNSNVLIVRLLLEHGADVNPVLINLFSNPTPLREAVLLANPIQILEILLTYGANVDPELPQEPSASEQLMPPLILAVVSGNTSTVQILLKAGANINRWCPKHGNALQAAVVSNNIRMLRISVQENADVNAPSHLSMKLQAW